MAKIDIDGRFWHIMEETEIEKQRAMSRKGYTSKV